MASGSNGVFAVEESIKSLLDQSITRNFFNTITDQGGKICVEYVWIGGSMQDMRSKARTLDSLPTNIEVRVGPHRALRGRIEHRITDSNFVGDNQH